MLWLGPVVGLGILFIGDSLGDGGNMSKLLMSGDVIV